MRQADTRGRGARAGDTHVLCVSPVVVSRTRSHVNTRYVQRRAGAGTGETCRVGHRMRGGGRGTHRFLCIEIAPSLYERGNLHLASISLALGPAQRVDSGCVRVRPPSQRHDSTGNASVVPVSILSPGQGLRTRAKRTMGKQGL